MLRVTLMSRSRGRAVLRLDGSIADEGVELLARSVGNHLRAGRLLALELDGVSHIDAKGLALIEAWPAAQRKLYGGSAYVRLLLAERRLAVTDEP